MASRWRLGRWRLGRRRLRLRCRRLGLRPGCRLPWCGCRRLPRGRQRLFGSSWRCRDRRRDRICRRRRDRWHRRNLPDGGWSDQCGERYACTRFRPALPAEFRRLCRDHHARDGADQGGDHHALGMYSPSAHSGGLRGRHAVTFPCLHTLAWPSRRAPNLQVARTSSSDSRPQPATISIVAGADASTVTAGCRLNEMSSE